MVREKIHNCPLENANICIASTDVAASKDVFFFSKPSLSPIDCQPQTEYSPCGVLNN